MKHMRTNRTYPMLVLMVLIGISWNIHKLSIVHDPVKLSTETAWLVATYMSYMYVHYQLIRWFENSITIEYRIDYKS